VGRWELVRIYRFIWIASASISSAVVMIRELAE